MIIITIIINIFSFSWFRWQHFSFSWHYPRATQ